MRVFGIDPGTTCTGYGIVDFVNNSLAHVDNGGISPSAKLPLNKRLNEIYSSLASLIEKHRPDTVVIEGLFMAKNARSSLILGHARGVAILAASKAGLDIAEYSPAEVKKAIVGTGMATKHQIQQMVKMMLKLPEIAIEDASDALAIAICHCNSYRLRSLYKT